MLHTNSTYLVTDGLDMFMPESIDTCSRIVPSGNLFLKKRTLVVCLGAEIRRSEIAVADRLGDLGSEPFWLKASKTGAGVPYCF